MHNKLNNKRINEFKYSNLLIQQHKNKAFKNI